MTLASLARLPDASTARSSSSDARSLMRWPSARATASPSGPYPVPVSSASAPAVTTRRIVISLRVSVPVLSEQMTDADPRVSTDESVFTMAPRWARRCTPSASTTVSTAGNPSGTAATASDTTTRATSTTSPVSSISVVARMAAITTMAIRITAAPRIRPTRATSRCSGVGSTSCSCNMPATWPSSVSIPVATTTAVAVPRVTSVPM